MLATRMGFRSVSISQSLYDIQKEEIVVTNAYSTFAEHAD